MQHKKKQDRSIMVDDLNIKITKKLGKNIKKLGKNEKKKMFQGQISFKNILMGHGNQRPEIELF